MNVTKPIPIPVRIPYFRLVADKFSKAEAYFKLSKLYPFSILTVFIDEIACSAFPPALAYSYFYLFALLVTKYIYKKEVKVIAGINTNRTRAKSQPLTNAIVIAEIARAQTNMTMENFYPIAP